MANGKIKFTCVEVTQPIGTFYMGVIDYKDLIEISWADVRGLENKKRDVEIYSGIQRQLSLGRVKEISKYVGLVDATFPTSVILAVESKDIDYDSKNHVMTVSRDQNVAKILDGQHRIAGLKENSLIKGKFQINVALFVDMELEDQAIVFATINKTHTKVNKSLAWDLFDFATTRSPQKTAHNIARALNEKKTSPFYEKIKILGIADDKEKETITQATFVESLINYISNDPMTDRDLYKRKKKPEKVFDAKLRRYFLRNLFIDEKDVDIAQIIFNYFSSVSEKWPNAWNQVRVDMILNKSTGFVALMRFLKDAYLSFNDIGSVISKEDFDKIFKFIDLKEKDFNNKQKYIPGAIGQTALYKDLLDKSGIKLNEK